MRKRITTILLAAAAASLALAASAFAVRAIGIYSNNMDSVAKRKQIVKVSGRNCNRGGSDRAFRIVVGKATTECSYRTPVVGRDLEVLATGRLLSGTPRGIRKRTFIALNLRTGGGGTYQLAVFPRLRKYQLRKDLPDGSRKFLAIGKGIKRIHGINQANDLRLRAFNREDTQVKGDVRLLVFIGDKRMAVVTDSKGGELEGRFSGVSVGSSKSASGAVASFDDVGVRVPSPF
jgi:hypothetical protein